METVVRAATCGRALSCRNNTGICTLFLLFLMFLSSIEDVVWLLLSYYHNWCSAFQKTRGELFASSPGCVHRRGHSPPFPFLFKGTAPLIDTNIWQCLLTILPLQSSTDFRRFTPSFVRNLILMRSFTWTCTFASLTFFTTDKTAQ